MRELLCKAKRKEKERYPEELQWVEGYLLKYENTYYICPKPYLVEEGWSHEVLDRQYIFGQFVLIDEETLCQLTHMTDINGKKVWENDIVKTSNGFILQVVWSDEYQEFLFKNIKGGYDFMKGMISELKSFTKDNKFRIIGNAFYR